ncbi:tRNA (adenosine(37)-N6)-threonylcarbamoyltransferase complex ATPase subunit type 1 TsaE [Sphingomonas sp. SFZ2018-12]|uniref:tRNA (adenosine(37)-N6)-threonylcarbamoyltransferase complex ATPase subunit type 1 TsaE n=1 Tax=Sphingomonas sp. SFZ2018-12 TaxID=2683197 RepID=UPI00082C0D75|nr:tRNA (adenosine(37)-N6)-threonylcarbamoyltransferase complex ATPase subunit type 1 TsaE [Sphingomonas sp. SFZ2018-12]MCH4892733.1 tRNA (adenosine(37)-N6)-threonylcarbamoyltransferase complex ATPase subunit type 1 TsaE [Sphingomonas sp. SFZ2018-12]
MSANLLWSIEDSLALGARIARVARPGDVVTLSGPLGAGKTSIARGLLNELGLEGEAPSPSYAIVQPYAPPEVQFPVLHVDLYRIEDAEEAVELGLWEARHDSLLVVEWPERLPELTWVDALRLTLLIESDGVRRLTAMVPEAWRQRWSLI